MTPALPQDLDALSLPLSYITWQVRSVDGENHAVSIYDSTSSELVVNKTDEKVDWAREKAGNLTALRVGTVEQPVLGSSGDDHRINWGYAYAAAPASQAKCRHWRRQSFAQCVCGRWQTAGVGRRANAARRE